MLGAWHYEYVSVPDRIRSRPSEMIAEAEIRRIAVRARARNFSLLVRNMHDWQLPATLLPEYSDFLREDEILDFRGQCEEFGIRQREGDLLWEPI